jgi:hypothetical protein
VPYTLFVIRSAWREWWRAYVVDGEQHQIIDAPESTTQALNVDATATCIVLDDVLTRVPDVYLALEQSAGRMRADARLVVGIRNRIWQPLIRLQRRLTGDRTPMGNWIPPSDIVNLLEQTGFEIVRKESAVLFPAGIPVIGRFLNRWIAPLPLFRSLCVYNVVVARRGNRTDAASPSVSVVVAARNEAGNIPSLIDRLPQLADVQELIFVEGGSRDETWEVIQREIADRHGSRTVLRAARQTGKGKGDAVRLGFSMATGDILIILDADLSVPPEELPRFIDLLRAGKCEFANGSRLVYPMEKEAMQFLNLIGNRLFGIAFTYLLGQPVRDTLCGTKALWRRDYERIAARRSYFGELDPFGDFDLLFGAARLNLRIRDVPVHYKERTYGSTNISRFRHGLLLLRMTALAARRLKFVPLRIERP